jgi:hypothetical protein
MKKKLDFAFLKELDSKCKEMNRVIGRYVTVGFADRTAVYVVTGETKRMYTLEFAVGEDLYPSWGSKVNLFKREVVEIIEGREKISSIFPPKE